ncbi:MAG: tRNA (adenosine(37)-N6)-threonylcarbamoyltransferase complex dimerization subunit type 1 TsaB [Candidatus Izimaplasma sp.]|nr:tRNA (adenosine(37)-N6)-threonylcarbamoyltransferase complex dimerization subunit type 1 TsaB [Candidatus Izimaplasma bacterium]
MKKLLKRLIIDSATKHLYVSLYKGNQELTSYYKKGNNDHSEKLMPEIKRQLDTSNIQVSDLDEIIIGIGPGSYTGLRIGVVVAKMFGWDQDITVKEVSSLALIASSYDQEGFILPEIDARRGNSFLGLYKNKDNKLLLIEKEELTNLETYKTNLTCEFTVLSEGKPNITKILNSSVLREVKDIHTLTPNYLRKTQAEKSLETNK